MDAEDQKKDALCQQAHRQLGPSGYVPPTPEVLDAIWADEEGYQLRVLATKNGGRIIQFIAVHENNKVVSQLTLMAWRCERLASNLSTKEIANSERVNKAFGKQVAKMTESYDEAIARVTKEHELCLSQIQFLQATIKEKESRIRMEGNGQTFQADRRSLWKQFLDKIFPYHFNEKRSDFIGSGNGKGMTTEVFICLDWLDKIRVLMGGVIKVEITINTEYEPGKVESLAFTNVKLPGSIPRRAKLPEVKESPHAPR